MKNIKCSECGLVSWSDAAVCRRCGKAFDETDAPTQGFTMAPPRADFSLPEMHSRTHSRSYWTTFQDHRLFVLSSIGVIAGIIVLGFLLNQTYFVSRWFMPKEIAEILQNLDERTEKRAPDKLVDIRDRVKKLAVHASRGREKAIRELVNMDVATAGIRVPNPATREAEARQNLLQAMPQGMVNDVPNSLRETQNLRAIAYDPAMTGSYLKREASIGEYVGDILAHIGEPAVEPIMERIKSVHATEKSGDTTMAAEMPRELLIALGKIKSPRALDLLIACASSKPYSYNNVKVIEALSFYEVDDPRLLEIYDMALTEARTPTDQVKTFNGPYAIRVASDGLARIKSEASIKILISHLDLSYWENGPSYVVKALARVGKPALPALLELVRDPTAPQSARQNAVQVLGLLKAPEARPDVIAMLDSAELHKPAARALVEWAKMDTIPDLEAAKERHPEWGWEFDDAIQRIKR